jgi:hypothetical protein
VLPQENYIEYDLADLQQKRTRLTEEQILWKLLVELILDSLQRTVVPIEMLDEFSFRDILKIRQPLLQSSFQTKYDMLMKSIVGKPNAERFSLLSVDDQESIRADLAQTFREVLEKELPFFLKRKAIQHSRQLATVSSSIALNLLGLAPGLGLIAGVAGILKDSPALVFNLGDTYDCSKSNPCP